MKHNCQVCGTIHQVGSSLFIACLNYFAQMPSILLADTYWEEFNDRVFHRYFKGWLAIDKYFLDIICAQYFRWRQTVDIINFPNQQNKTEPFMRFKLQSDNAAKVCKSRLPSSQVACFSLILGIKRPSVSSMIQSWIHFG